MASEVDPLESVIADVATRLAGVARIVEGEARAKENTSPPLYIWTRESVQSSNRYQETGGYSHSLQTDAYENEIRIWGHTKNDVFVMRAALFTALRQTLKGRRYSDGPARFATKDEQVSTLGYEWIQPMTVYLQLPEIALPAVQTPPAQGTYQEPATYTGEATFLPVTITAVVDSASGAVEGDGILQPGDL